MSYHVETTPGPLEAGLGETARTGGRAGRRSDPVRDTLRRVDRLRLDCLPPGVLERMGRDLEDRRAVLRGEIGELERRLDEVVERGDAPAFTALKRRLRRQGKAYEELAAERRRVEGARQERILEDRLIARLGSRLRLRVMEGGVLGLILFILGLLLYELTTPGLSLEAHKAIFLADTLCCAVFLAEFFFRLAHAESKRWFWKRHWIDFVTSIPIPDFQALRFGRLARLARFTRVMRFLRLLRALRILLFFWRGMDKIHEALNVRLMKKALLLAFLFLMAGTLVIYWAEGKMDPAVGSLEESFWWSITTVITGGFADIYNPDSAAGRILTVVLVLAGMILIGIFTATLTSVLVGDDSEQLSRMQQRLEKKLDTIADRVGRLEREG